MKKIFKKFLIVLMVGVFLVLSGCNIPPRKKVFTDAWLNSTYDAGIHCDEYAYSIPVVEQLGEYKDAIFYEFETIILGDMADITFCLVVEYDKENYFLEKQKALQNYEFQSEIIEDGDGYFLLPFVEREIGTYTVKVMKDFTDMVWSKFPKKMGLVAYSDENMQIRYCYLYSESIDFLYNAEYMENYIRNSITLGW